MYRIWKIRSSIGKGNLFIANSPLTNLLVVLIESGVIYTLSIVILCVVYVASHNAEYGVSNTVRCVNYFSCDIYPDWFAIKIVQIIVCCHLTALLSH